MPDRIFMPLMALVAFAMIAFSLVWPQGYGDRSPIFGSTPIQQTPAMRDAIEREKAGARRRAEEAARAVGAPAAPAAP